MMNSYGERQSKKQNSKQDDDHHQPRNRMEGLPREIVLDIVSRLPVKSIIRLRFVCKTFYNLSHDPDLVQMHLSRAVKSNNTCLIFHCVFSLSNKLYFVELSEHDENKNRVGEFHTPFSTSVPKFHVVGSCDGLLCLVNSFSSDVVYIYNPFTRQYKDLPRSIEFKDQQVMYGFGFHPITMEYKVIKIIYYADTCKKSPPFNRFILKRYIRSEVQVFSLGGNKWRSIGEIPYQLDRKSTVALVNGRLHWVSKHGTYQGRSGRFIISFDIADELFREVPQSDCMDPLTLYGCHLAVLGGCLSVALPVRERQGGLDIWIMKEYNVEESWVKQFSIEAYLPKPTNPDFVRVLCLVENGEILVECNGETLAAYNPENGTFKHLSFPGMPRLFQTIVHVGSLNWIG